MEKNTPFDIICYPSRGLRCNHLQDETFSAALQQFCCHLINDSQKSRQELNQDQHCLGSTTKLWLLLQLRAQEAD